ncbi:MAG TPA: tetratricopeptide repeat protein [Holophaga sp.]|nr:tetratricopeptide repeat protein [Holophaga sp.]
MRLVNIVFVLLIGLFLAWLVTVYSGNLPVFSSQVHLWKDVYISVLLLVVLVFFAGLVLNVFYSGYMEIRRMVKNFNASAATRAGKRISTLLQEAQASAAHGLWQEARETLQAILRERPSHVPACLLLGEVLMKQGDTETAVKHLETLCLAHPELVEAQYQLADTLVAARDQAGATELLKRLAGEHPKSALRALRRLRALHAEAGRWDEALDVHKRLASRFPGELNQAEKSQGAALSFQVGLVKVEADLFKEASQIFQQVLKEDPAFVPAYLALGRCMILQDQESQGLEIWLEGFRATGEGALLQEVEDYFIQCGRPEEGLAVLQRVAATSVHQTTAKFFLGKMYYRLEILDEALVLFQEVRAQVVYSPILFFFMAKIHGRRGRQDQALNEYRQLLRNLGVLKLRYECSVCGKRVPDYQDRCETCGSWNSFHFIFKENELAEVHLRPESGSWLSLA